MLLMPPDIEPLLLLGGAVVPAAMRDAVDGPAALLHLLKHFVPLLLAALQPREARRRRQLGLDAPAPLSLTLLL